MKKILLCLCVILTLALSNALSVAACWAAPEPFEIFSDDGNKVFVFIPDEDALANAYAAVYEIINNNERQIIYTLKDLSSFSYESNFYFSNDMMHFIRRFNESGMPAFEVFSNGVRTRVIMRNDFIKNYAKIEAETSVGPLYSVGWQIEEHTPQNAIFAINTDEGNTFLFDLTTAEFTPKNILFTHNNFSPVVIIVIIASVVVAISIALFFLKKRKKIQ